MNRREFEVGDRRKGPGGSRKSIEGWGFPGCALLARQCAEFADIPVNAKAGFYRER